MSSSGGVRNNTDILTVILIIKWSESLGQTVPLQPVASISISVPVQLYLLFKHHESILTTCGRTDAPKFLQKPYKLMGEAEVEANSENLPEQK